ncbi:MAG: hypothetical protein FJX71_03230 [Alphaproteobacteria bacterium]|nr:hypothetical protein [Alphaproteobacteria bacterium]
MNKQNIILFFKKVKKAIILLKFIINLRFKLKYDVVFFSHGVIDEIWIRTTAAYCLNQGLKILIIIIDTQNNEKIKKFYQEHAINFIIVSHDWLLKFVKTDTILTATSCISKTHFNKQVKNFIYMPHSLVSLHSVYPDSAFDDFNIIFASGPHHLEEFREIKKRKGQSYKGFKVGYGKLDLLKEKPKSSKPLILLAPSWGEYNFKNVFNKDLIENLLCTSWELVLRPHPLTIRQEEIYLDELKLKHPELIIDLDVSNTSFLEKASILITDYSGISMEFMALHQKPVIFLNLPAKIINQNFHSYNSEAMEQTIRTIVPNQIVEPDPKTLKKSIERLLKEKPTLNKSILDLFIYNRHQAGNFGAKYLKELTGI